MTTLALIYLGLLLVAVAGALVWEIWLFLMEDRL